MDCLCINQRDEEELAFEISKLRQYYRSAKVTLIPIQKEIDRNISLSSLQPKGDGKAEMEEVFSAALDIIKMIVRSDWFRRTWTFQEGLLSPQTVFMFDDCLVDGRFLAMVWSIKQAYYEEGYNPEDEIYLSLFQALKAIERRERFIIVDGIYSVLGLLSYGSKVRPKYKENNHYTKKDFVEELVNVMKIAVENGHGEPLS
ncbi:6113_t:CDS:2 [Paraglomus occultum]|uniref:6113_t:CDS:1 n=1 Tax=Paraglomus occultum TaxID=144539 RepID=A0A9N9FTE6_9GLOM|nr:6113_t:CDS:2 [Paraglomus occultum]